MKKNKSEGHQGNCTLDCVQILQEMDLGQWAVREVIVLRRRLFASVFKNALFLSPPCPKMIIELGTFRKVNFINQNKVTIPLL